MWEGVAYMRGGVAWDRFHMDLAERVALLSKDPDRKVGAVLVTASRRQLSIGYNGFPSSVADRPELLADRAFKLAHMVHAEENCLQQAPFPTAGCTLFVTRFPCAACAKLILAAGVCRLVAPRPDLKHPRWGTSWSLAVLKLKPRVHITFMEQA